MAFLDWLEKKLGYDYNYVDPNDPEIEVQEMPMPYLYFDEKTGEEMIKYPLWCEKCTVIHRQHELADKWIDELHQEIAQKDALLKQVEIEEKRCEECHIVGGRDIKITQLKRREELLVEKVDRKKAETERYKKMVADLRNILEHPEVFDDPVEERERVLSVPFNATTSEEPESPFFDSGNGEGGTSKKGKKGKDSTLKVKMQEMGKVS